jgi:hypothetical protein
MANYLTIGIDVVLTIAAGVSVCLWRIDAHKVAYLSEQVEVLTMARTADAASIEELLKVKKESEARADKIKEFEKEVPMPASGIDADYLRQLYEWMRTTNKVQATCSPGSPSCELPKSGNTK